MSTMIHKFITNYSSNEKYMLISSLSNIINGQKNIDDLTMLHVQSISPNKENWYNIFINKEYWDYVENHNVSIYQSLIWSIIFNEDTEFIPDLLNTLKNELAISKTEYYHLVTLFAKYNQLAISDLKKFYQAIIFLSDDVYNETLFFNLINKYYSCLQIVNNEITNIIITN